MSTRRAGWGPAPLPPWRNWQTPGPQKAVSYGAYGFESRRGHVTQDEYDRFVAAQRREGSAYVTALTTAWRRELWPWGSDPIEREDDRRRERLARALRMDAYLGLSINRPRMIYGGICAG